MKSPKHHVLCLSALLLVLMRASSSHAQGAPSAEELAKQTQNPVASLITAPLQGNWDFGVGDRDGRQRSFMPERHLGPSRFESEQVRLVEMDLRGLFDYDDPIAIRDPRCQGVQQRRLSRSRPSGDEDVALGGDRSNEPLGQRLR